MREVSFWDLVKDSPEWAGVIASTAFAFVTVCVITWQVCVMIWQGRNSDRHERAQNRLLRLQHEHEWLLQTNRERGQLLTLGRKLHLAAGCLKLEQSNTDSHFWNEVVESSEELNSRLKILDVAAFTGENDVWFPDLTEYVEAIQRAVADDFKFHQTFDIAPESPSLSTRKALKEAGERYNPIRIFLDVESAIGLEFLDFKRKWDSETADR